MVRIMNNLFTYVSALKEESPGLCIVEKVLLDNSFEDEGILITSTELTVKFENGVTLKQQIEFEGNDNPTDMVCSECWISYEIILVLI